MSSGFNLELLIPMGRLLLLGSSGYAIYQVIRGEYDFEEAVIGIGVGLLALTFFVSGFDVVKTMSESLLVFLTNHMSRDGLEEQIVKAIHSSASAKAGSVPDSGEFFGQIWRAGLWGVVSSFVELVFVLTDVLIESAQSVFLLMIGLLFPLGCGLFPVFPKILVNLVVYSIELNLWRPLLIVVHEVTAQVGRAYLANDSSNGLKILAVEIVAIVLILSIPAVTHKIMSGALAGDFGAGGGFSKAGRKLYGSVSSTLGGVFR